MFDASYKGIVMTDNSVPQAQTQTNWLNREPVAIMYLVQTGIALGVAFGFDLTPEQMAGILAFTGALLTVFTRTQVTPFVAVGTTPMAGVATTPSISPIVAEAKPVAGAEAPLTADTK
jgi:hypothetical protein